LARRIVLVSGPPGAGKSTLAAPLAAALGFPLISKDVIKEAIWDAMAPPPGDLSWSRRCGAAAMEVLWALAARCPQAVLEANFRPRSPYERGRIAALAARLVEVRCRCPAEEAARRYAARAKDPSHHPAHVVHMLAPEAMAEYEGDMGGGPVIQVDTTGPVDVAAVAGEVQRLLAPDAVRAVLVAGGRVLLAQHNNRLPENVGKWGLPGGHIEPGDASPEAALRREMREELGIELGPVTLVGDWPHKGRVHRVFAAEPQGEITAWDPAEILEVRWVRPAEAAALPLHTGFEVAAIALARQGGIRALS
jgi:8-oxo-dGTP pyrophosphatase MutT (NUDIX family)/predicted kinase